jgi:hypothetical protein
LSGGVVVITACFPCKKRGYITRNRRKIEKAGLAQPCLHSSPVYPHALRYAGCTKRKKPPYFFGAGFFGGATKTMGA